MPSALDFPFKDFISPMWIWKSGANGLAWQCSYWTNTLAAFVSKGDRVEHSAEAFLFPYNYGFWMLAVLV